MRIALFATCLADTMFPQAAQATVTILERLGHQVCFPEGQVCCGQMHANTGYFKQAAKITRNHVDTFSPVLDGEWDAIVIPSGSCTGAARHEAGSPNVVGAAALAAACDALAGFDADAVTAHEEALCRRLLDGGRDLWVSHGRDTTLEVPTRQSSGYPVVERNDAPIRAYRDDVLEILGKQPLIDVRSPQEYTEQDAAGGEMFGMPLLTQEDLAAIEDTEHVTEVKTYRVAEPEYIQGPDDRKWQTGFMGSSGEIDMLTFSAGRAPEAGAAEIVMPESWVEDLGAGDAEDLVGTELTVVAATPLQEHKSVTATVVGVTKAAASGAGTAPTPSESLEQAIYDITTEGLPESQRDTYFQATAIVEDPEANEDAVKQALADQGLLAQTLEEQLGVIRGIIDAVTWVLTGFALIALLAASFGIINTLLMAVQERTREIGLMKALGMTGGKIFGLFTMEAVVIGLLGSLIGIGLGVAVGLIANQVLTTGPLSGVTGLVLFAVNPLALLLILLLIVAIAFIAGTLPALRAARKDPIEALRHE